MYQYVVFLWRFACLIFFCDIADFYVVAVKLNASFVVKSESKY